MEVADTALPEDVIPVNIAFFQLGNGGIAPVGATLGAPASEAALHEVQAVADGASDAVEGDPADEPGIHAALQDEILHEASYWIVGEGGDHGGAEAEAAAEAPGHVVFSAALPDVEGAGGVDPAFAGVQTEHDLAEAEFIEKAGFCGLVFDHGIFPYMYVPEDQRLFLISTAALTAARMPSQLPASMSALLPSQVPPTATTSLRAR